MQSMIQTPAGDLKDSLDFYTRLEFKIISRDKSCLVSDGRVLIEINPDRFARAGIKLFSQTWKPVADKLAKITTLIKIEHGYLLSDPSGTWIYLLENPPVFEDQLSSITPSVLGKFVGVSLETVAVNLALEIWQNIGFTKNMGSLEQGWINLVNQAGLTISLMKPFCCPHLFFNPSLTYFNGKDNLAVIDRIRALNIPISEEISFFNESNLVDNIIIRDPGGYGFFIFND